MILVWDSKIVYDEGVYAFNWCAINWNRLYINLIFLSYLFERLWDGLLKPTESCKQAMQKKLNCKLEEYHKGLVAWQCIDEGETQIGQQ